MPRFRSLTATAVALASTSLVMSAAPAHDAHASPAGDALVINEVYGAGGNSGALFDADFVELYNPTDQPISLAGLAIHYRSATGGSGGNPLALSGMVPAGGHWLIQMSGPGANGEPLPTPDQVASPAFNMAAAGGQVALQLGTTTIATSGDTTATPGIVDFVGAGTATSYETAPTGIAATSTLSLNRTDGVDTDDNSADFTLAAPTPTSSTSGAMELALGDPGALEWLVDEPIEPLQLVATGGTAPYTFDVAVDDLPPGVVFDGEDTLTGIPTAIGSFSVAVSVTDSAVPDPATADGELTIEVVEPSLGPVAGAVADQWAVAGLAIAPFAVTATGGTGAYTFSSGTLPDGLTVDAATGVVSGVPTEVGEHAVVVTITDEAELSDDAEFTIEVVAPIKISEAYGAGGFDVSGDLPASLWLNDFIELYNPTDADVDLTGWYIAYGSPTRNPGTPSPVALNGTIPANGHFLIQAAGGSNGAPLPTPDQTIATNLGAASGFVVLTTANNVTIPIGDIAGTVGVVDALGYGAANTFEAHPEGTLLGGVLSAQRVDPAVDTNDNDPDFAAAAPTPTNSAGDTTAPLTFLDPGALAYIVGEEIAPIVLQAGGGTPPYTFAVDEDALPEGLTFDGTDTISGTPDETGSFSVAVTVTDSADSPAVAGGTLTINVSEPPESTPIAEIQGTGDTSPLVGEVVTTEGIVTAVYADGGLNGFYLQTAGTGSGEDATPGASDAVFVYGGSNFATKPEASQLQLGDSVVVTGAVSEFSGTTQITYTALDWLDDPLDPVTPLVVTDWADFDTPAEKEAHEGELLLPGTFTVTNAYGQDSAGNWYGEIGVAAGDRPLVTPTEIADAQDTAAIAAVEADNAARSMVLDDGTSRNYRNAALTAEPMPWWGAESPARVGAAVTWNSGVVLEYRNSVWKFQPQLPLLGDRADGTATATFEATRYDTPHPVGGDLRLATFNVLNYFPTTGEEFVAMGGGRSCTWYTDRDGNRITVNSCNPNGPRGAANVENLERQTAKIALAINSLDASVVSLEELENSIYFGKDRDFAIAYLVDELNAAAGADVWDYVPSPDPADLPLLAEQDVIRTGFIYKPADVELVGGSRVLVGSAAFANAREPLAQAFRPVGGADDHAFIVIVNHFKSKGSGVDDGTGQGNANPDRIAQATDLAAFADAVADDLGIDAVFLVGDFNSYSMEDPIQVLESAGYERVEPAAEDYVYESSYSFGGMSGSLDHVLANEAAFDLVTGADIWNINGEESVIFQYSRHNYNVLELFDPTTPYAASDHNPEVVGLAIGVPTTVTYDGDDPTNADTVEFTVTFAEPVTGFTTGDVVVDGGAAVSVTGGPTTYVVGVDVDVTGGVVAVSVPAGVAEDAGGTTNQASNTATVTVDRVAPTVAVAAVEPTVDAGDDVAFTVTFAGGPLIGGLSVADLDISGTAITPIVVGGPTVYTVTFPAVTTPGTITLAVLAGAVTDAAGNPNVASPAASVDVVAAATTTTTEPGGTTTTIVAPTDGPAIVPVEPGRYWDTRDEGVTGDGVQQATGRLAAGATHRIPVAGRLAVPDGAQGIVANLTVILPGAVGFATMFPCTSTPPDASSLNYFPGDVVANNVIVPLSDDGAVCVYTLEAADFALDINGFVGADAPDLMVDPARYLDTRGGQFDTFDGQFAETDRPTAGDVTRVRIAGRGGVPADARAAIVNVTTVLPDANGFVSLVACDDDGVPDTSTVNFLAGQIVPNGAVAELSDGDLCIYSSTGVDLLVDVTGFVPAGVTSIATYEPVRLFDSRPGAPTYRGPSDATRLEAGVPVAIHASETASAMFFNVATVVADGPGFVSLYPTEADGSCSDAVPGTSNVNFVAGSLRANNAFTKLGPDGSVCVYAYVGVDVVVDATGSVYGDVGG